MPEFPDEVVVSMRVGEAPAILPGSETRQCPSCDEAVVVSPGTLEAIAGQAYPETVVCLTCVLKNETEPEASQP